METATATATQTSTKALQEAEDALILVCDNLQSAYWYFDTQTDRRILGLRRRACELQKDLKDVIATATV